MFGSVEVAHERRGRQCAREKLLARARARWHAPEMALITTQDAGMAVWVDTMVSSLDLHRRLMDFYSGVFGWTWDVGAEEMGHYSLARHNGQPVLGLAMSPEGDANMITYFSTVDMSDSLARALELGGTVLFGPHQVIELGVTAIVRDRVGAVHGLWQVGTFSGFGVMYEPGAPGWFDHVSPDPDAAATYYAGLLGHQVFEPEAGMRILRAGEQWFASVSHDQVGDRPARWNPIFVVESLARCRETVRSLGATVVLEEMPVPGSAISVFVDPVTRKALTVMAAGSPPD